MKIVTNGKKYRIELYDGVYCTEEKKNADGIYFPLQYDTLEEAKQGIKDNTWVEVDND